MVEFVAFGSPAYYVMLCGLVLGRGLDFLSTWIATPNLMLEANPVAKKLGWRLGLFSNAVICGIFAVWPLPSIVIMTTSLLVAARNFQSAWLMRTLGEGPYRVWMGERLAETHRGLYLVCLFAQSAIYAGIGAALVSFSRLRLIPFGIGMGMITYAIAVTVYSLLSVWRFGRTKL